MEKTERIALAVAFVVLVALVIAKYREPGKTLLDVQPVLDESGSLTKGPLYLMGNMPWAFQPWAPSAVPQLTTGQVGQSPGLTQGTTDLTPIGTSGL